MNTATKIVLATALVLTGLAPTIVTAQPVVNPSFETGDTSGWTIIPNGSGKGDILSAVKGIFGVTPSSGTYMANLSLPSTSGPPGVTYYTDSLRSSTFSVTAGSAVTFEWRVRTLSDQPYARAELFDAVTNTVVNTFFKKTFPASSTVWTKESFTVTATGTYYLEFQGGSFDSTFGGALSADFYVDNINGVPAAANVSKSAVNVTEGGATDTYTVSLMGGVPTANVTITPTVAGLATFSPATLTFTPANYTVPQTITVTAVDDVVIQGPHSATISHASTSTDLTYNGITVSSVTVNITDNDPSGKVTVSKTGVNVTEGGSTDAYTVSITGSKPTSNVTINLNVPGQVTVAPKTLTFTPLNYNIPQTVTITAIDDIAVEGKHSVTITHSATSTDLSYSSVAVASVVVSIKDNDSLNKFEGTFALSKGSPGALGKVEGIMGHGNRDFRSAGISPALRGPFLFQTAGPGEISRSSVGTLLPPGVTMVVINSGPSNSTQDTGSSWTTLVQLLAVTLSLGAVAGGLTLIWSRWNARA